MRGWRPRSQRPTPRQSVGFPSCGVAERGAAPPVRSRQRGESARGAARGLRGAPVRGAACCRGVAAALTPLPPVASFAPSTSPSQPVAVDQTTRPQPPPGRPTPPAAMHVTPRLPPVAERGYQRGTWASTTAGTICPVALRGESADRRNLATSAPNASAAIKATQSLTASASDRNLIQSTASEALRGPNDTQAPAPAAKVSNATRRVPGGRARAGGRGECACGLQVSVAHGHAAAAHGRRRWELWPMYRAHVRSAARQFQREAGAALRSLSRLVGNQ